jgi:hypothetical protein
MEIQKRLNTIYFPFVIGISVYSTASTKNVIQKFEEYRHY